MGDIFLCHWYLLFFVIKDIFASILFKFSALIKFIKKNQKASQKKIKMVIPFQGKLTL